MYPRNAASPERIAVGAVVQISDGAVQTSGVTITVRGQGGEEGTGGGTTAYGASGIVYYTPTQAETNFTSFVVIGSKTGCIPVAQTIATTASSVPGNVILASATHTGAVIPTVTNTTQLNGAATVVLTDGSLVTAKLGSFALAKTTNITGFNDIAATAIVSSGAINTSSGAVTTVTNLTNLPSIPANWITTAGITDGALTAAKFAAASLNGKGDWNIGKTGYSLTAGTGLGNQTSDITGSLSGSVGSVTGAVGSVTAVVDANIKQVNDVPITGTGIEGSDEWRPA